MRGKRSIPYYLITGIIYSIWIGFLAASAHAQDIPGANEPPGLQMQSPMQNNVYQTGGESSWHVDVNSGCSWSDHTIYLDIDVDPTEINGARITMTNWDVDYNDPQGCQGGPEVDFLYVNGNFIGQLQGANNSWSTNVFDISSNVLVKGQNTIYVDLDVPNTGCWCVGVGYVEITGKVGFAVAQYTPTSGASNVSWDNPNITIDFTEEVDTSTVNSDTIKLRYRNQTGSYVQVDADLSMLSAKRVQVIPKSALKDGVWYGMAVMGGASGVKAKDGADLSSDTYWSFSTMVDLDGTTSNIYKPNTTKDKIQVAWFNVSRDAHLVPKKSVVYRVYALWDKKSDVYEDDQVDRIGAKVSLTTKDLKEEKTDWFYRPDKWGQYGSSSPKQAWNTVNFYDWVGASGAMSDKVQVTIEPLGQAGTPKQYSVAASYTVDNGPRKIEFDAYACEMAGWYHGVKAGELQAATNTLSGGVDYTTDVFPITGCVYNDRGTIARGSGGFNMTETIRKKSSWWFNEEVRYVNCGGAGEMEEIRCVINHLHGLKPGSHPFVAGLVAHDALPGATGVSSRDVVLFAQGEFNESTVAHELGHAYGLHHDNSNDTIEGFRVSKHANKSFTDGNSEATNLASLMHEVIHDTEERWILPAQYSQLLGSVRVSVARPTVRAQTGEFMAVQGFVNEDGTISTVLPLYNTTQRHLPEPTGSGYTAEFFDSPNGAGTSLGEFHFDIGELVVTSPDGSLTTINSLMFAFSIPFDDAAQSLVITGPHNTKVINKSDFGAHAPSATFTNPPNGSTLSGTVNLTWTGSDDSGKVFYRLEYSPDGVSWIPISTQLEAVTGYRINTNQLPSGPGQKLALIAYDGFNTTRSEIHIAIVNSITVKQTVPLSGAINVFEGSRVAAYFTSDMDPATINTQSFSVYEGGTQAVVGQVIYDAGSRRATFIPDTPFQSNTTYTARLLKERIADVYGNTLANDFAWSFTTGESTVNPYITDVSPPQKSVNVPVNAIIQATFGVAIDPSTLTAGSFILADKLGGTVAGTVSYNAANRSARFLPSSLLAPNMEYRATVTTAITDHKGNHLGADYSWSFTTGTSQSGGVRIVEVVSDQAIDGNGDGMYDTLVVRVRVEVLNAGTYNMNGQLKDKYGDDIAWTSYEDYLPEGAYVVDLVFNGRDIGGHGVDGPYNLANLSAYNTSNVGIHHKLAGSYQTYRYLVAQFYSVIRLANVPDISVATDSTNEDVLNLEKYATHTTYDVSSLNYSILIDTNPLIGASVDASHNLDVSPAAGFSGFSDLTLEVKDGDGLRALNIVRIASVEAYKFKAAGWALICLTGEPANSAVAKVLASIKGKFDSVWDYSNGVWRAYFANAPEFSDLTKLEMGKAYWVHLTKPASLTLVGNSAEGQTDGLVKGWNLVGYNAMESRSITDALSSIAGRYLTVWGYKDGSWQAYFPDNPAMSDLSTLEPGYGIWIYAIMDTIWTLP